MCIRDSGVPVPRRADALLAGGATLFDPGFFEHRPYGPQERDDVARCLGLARAILLHAPFEQPELEVDLLPEQALDLRAPAPRVAGERVGQSVSGLQGAEQLDELPRGGNPVPPLSLI